MAATVTPPYSDDDDDDDDESDTSDGGDGMEEYETTTASKSAEAGPRICRRKKPKGRELLSVGDVELSDVNMSIGRCLGSETEQPQ